MNELASGTAEIVLVRRSGLMIEFQLRRPASPPSMAVLMLKYNLTDPDSCALVAKSITPAASTSGVISDPTSTRPVLRFILTELDTANLPSSPKLYTALKVWPTGGAAYSPLGGRRGVRVVGEGIHQT